MPFKKGVTPEGAKPFQPGQSGNPAGRPKVPDLSDLLEEEIGEEGFRKVVASLFKQAKGGNTNAIKEVLDRYYGTTVKKTEHTGKDGSVLLPPVIQIINPNV